MKGVLRICAILLGLMIAAYFLRFAFLSFDPSALAKLAQPRVLGAIVLATILYGLIVPMSAVAWETLLTRSAGFWPFRTLFGILAVTQLAKYVPGNLAQHASRVSLSLAHGMRPRDFVATVVVETILVVLSALAVGLISFAIADHNGFQPILNFQSFALIGCGVILALLLAAPLVMRLAVALAQKTRWSRPVTDWVDAVPRQRAQLTAFLIYCVNYLTIGLGFLLIARALGLGSQFGFALLTSAFALSWIAGFFAPGMPAGLGVREGVMTMMLVGSAPQGEVLSAITAMRIATIAGDILLFVSGGWLLANARMRRVNG